MVNACADPEFLSERGGGGGGVQAQRRETALIFFKFVLGFFSPKKIRGCGGWVQIFTRGGFKC